MSTPIDRARARVREWNADDGQRARTPIERIPEWVDCIADALEDLVADHDRLTAEVTRLTAELEQRIDPARLEALTIHPHISIVPLHGVSMAGDRWIITGGDHPGRRVDYARTFPEALAIAESRR